MIALGVFFGIAIAGLIWFAILVSEDRRPRSGDSDGGGDFDFDWSDGDSGDD